MRDRTGGRGADSVVEAVGMEAHGNPVAERAIKAMGLLPDAVVRPIMKKAGFDRQAALISAFECVRRGGTVSILGVYGGAADPMPMVQLFDKQLQLRMGQANVRAWTDDLMPLSSTTATRWAPGLRDPPAAAVRGGRGLQGSRQGGRHGEGGLHAVRPRPRGCFPARDFGAR